jgi:2-polyprenyl-3-methyl-5-hydroxy-6-metoxy-1,4-benzoquinol methylase
MFPKRSSGIELMDDLSCSGEVVDQTLRELEFINRTLGGNNVTVDGVMELCHRNPSHSISIIDLGCGGGDMLLLLKRKLDKRNLTSTLMGIDANPNIIHYATANCERNDSISFDVINIFSDEFKQLKFDIAVATLFFHHFSHEQLVGILTHLQRQARLGIVVNDLHRHPLAYYSIKLLTKVFSKSPMVQYDAPLSVLRGFSKPEMKSILDEAGIKKYKIKWKWAFRWQVIVDNS